MVDHLLGMDVGSRRDFGVGLLSSILASSCSVVF